MDRRTTIVLPVMLMAVLAAAVPATVDHGAWASAMPERPTTGASGTGA
jgi:hypothetical protein